MDIAGGILVALIAAFGGFAVGWVSRPAAQLAAEEKRLKSEQRRKVVADARALIEERFSDRDRGIVDIEEDRRFLAIRRHVPEIRGGFDLEILSDLIDGLEKRWDLI